MSDEGCRQVPGAGHCYVAIVAAYDGHSDLRYSGIRVDEGDGNRLLTSAAWCTLCGALGVRTTESGPFTWRLPDRCVDDRTNPGASGEAGEAD